MKQAFRYALVSTVVMGATNLTAAQTPPDDVVKPEEPVITIPADFSQRKVAVQIMVNGRGPYWFHIDTYASGAARVDHTLVAELNLQKTGTALSADGSGNPHERDVVRLDSVSLGAASFGGVTAIVNDLSWVPAPDGQALRGLLGFGLFRNLLLTIDYPQSIVSITWGELTPNEPGVIGYRDPSGCPDILLRIGEVDVWAGIDTGFSGTLRLGEETARTLARDDEPRPAGTARSMYTEWKFWSVRLADPLQFAGHDHRNVTIMFPDIAMPPLIGYDLISRYAVTFDQKQNLVRFASNEIKPIEVPPAVLDK